MKKKYYRDYTEETNTRGTERRKRTSHQIEMKRLDKIHQDIREYRRELERGKG